MEYLSQFFFAHVNFNGQESSRLESSVQCELQAFLRNILDPAFPSISGLMPAYRLAKAIEPARKPSENSAFRGLLRRRRAAGGCLERTFHVNQINGVGR